MDTFIFFTFLFGIPALTVWALRKKRTRWNDEIQEMEDDWTIFDDIDLPKRDNK